MIGEPTRRLDEGALRALVPRVLAGLVRWGEDFDAAEEPEVGPEGVRKRGAGGT